MSSRNYTVTIKLKDDGKLAGLQSLSNGGGGPSAGKGRSTTSSGLFGGDVGNILSKMAGLSGLQLIKLGTIAGSIATIATYTVKSSAILQGVFKMWDNAMTLIFKPFGDFIGMMFRPLTILMLQFAIGYYKTVGKWFQENGAKFGNWLAGQQNATTKLADEQVKQTGQALGPDALTGAIALENPIGTINGYLKQVQEDFKKLPDGVKMLFGDFNTELGKKLGNIPNGVVAVFGNFAGDLWKWLTNIPQVFSQIFVDFGTNILNGLVGIPGQIYDVFTGLVTNITTKLAGIPGAIYDAIVGWIKGLVGGLGGLLGGGGGGSTQPTAAGARTQMAQMAASVSI